MKITKLISGIVLIIMAVVVMLQYKFDSFIQALMGYADLGSTTSVLVALAFIIAGIIYIICNSNESIVPYIISFIILILGGAMGIFNALRFPGIMIWSWAGIVVGLMLLIAGVVTKYFLEPTVDKYGNAYSNSYYDNNNQGMQNTGNNYQQPEQFIPNANPAAPTNKQQPNVNPNPANYAGPANNFAPNPTNNNNYYNQPPAQSPQPGSNQQWNQPNPPVNNPNANLNYNNKQAPLNAQPQTNVQSPTSGPTANNAPLPNNSANSAVNPAPTSIPPTNNYRPVTNSNANSSPQAQPYNSPANNFNNQPTAQPKTTNPQPSQRRQPQPPQNQTVTPQSPQPNRVGNANYQSNPAPDYSANNTNNRKRRFKTKQRPPY